MQTMHTTRVSENSTRPEFRSSQDPSVLLFFPEVRTTYDFHQMLLQLSQEVMSRN